MDNFFSKYKEEIIAFLITSGLIGFMIYQNKTKANNNPLNNNIIIGDSQVPFIEKYTLNLKKEATLQKGGVGINWLIDALKNYPVNNSINRVVIVIGTNGGFNKNDKIKDLFYYLNLKFPNAKFYTIKGSWGWGGNIAKTENDVNTYYDLYKPYSVVLNTAIGYGEPHNPNKESYKNIGKELNNLFK